jgi:hypothetical protein
MKELKADWRRWSRVERIVAVVIAVGMGSMLPALLLSLKGSLRRTFHSQSIAAHGLGGW